MISAVIAVLKCDPEPSVNVVRINADSWQEFDAEVEKMPPGKQLLLFYRLGGRDWHQQLPGQDKVGQSDELALMRFVFAA